MRWNIFLVDDISEETSEIDKFVKTYAQDYGNYDFFLDLSNEYNGLLHCTVGNDRHGTSLAVNIQIILSMGMS